jgi:hypothetical protein
MVLNGISFALKETEQDKVIKLHLESSILLISVISTPSDKHLARAIQY